jgi:hypothetical protein
MVCLNKAIGTATSAARQAAKEKRMAVITQQAK